ncbi:hypothetical protein [Sediminibacillus albus]|nr:hypothetical protein [Sediminibacillus albus]
MNYHQNDMLPVPFNNTDSRMVNRLPESAGAKAGFINGVGE